MKFFLIVACCLASLLPFWPARGGGAGAADEYDLLRAKWRTMLTGGVDYDPADADIARRIAALDAEAQRRWDGLNKDPQATHLWPDLTSATDSAHNREMAERLRAMALALTTKGSRWYGDARLKADIVHAVEWFYANRYNPNQKKYGNGWEWEIGTPLRLNDVLALMYDDFTAAQIAKYMAAVGHFNPDFNRYGRSVATGANRVWKFTIQAQRGVLLKDGKLIAEARDGLSDAAGRGAASVFSQVTSGDGFYADGSFIQHDNFPYTGGYGVSFLNELANVLHLLNGSTWRVVDPAHANLFRWVYEAYEPLLYRGAMMDFVRGRTIARMQRQDHATGHDTLQGILRLSQSAPPADAARYRQLFKHHVSADTYRNFFAQAPVNLIVLGKAVMNDARIAPRGELIRHKQFSAMDRIVHLRSGFALALSLSSRRTMKYESINRENTKGWHTADGMTYLYNGDLAHYSEDYWPTVDAQRLPGTTVDTRPRDAVSLDNSRAFLSSRAWAGGADLDGLFGVAGMELEAEGSSLAARKSWFMFDDEIVALGAAINSRDGRPIETIIENRKLSGAGSNALTINGQPQPTASGWSANRAEVKWAHLAGSAAGADIGYYFPTAPAIKALRQTRAAAWKSINSYFSPANATELAAPRTRHYLALWFDHGANPANATYQYVLLPNLTRGATSQYARQPHIRVLENSDTAQAVTETRLKITGVNFWTTATKRIGIITCDGQAAVMLRESGDAIEIAVADPTQLNTGQLNLEINGAPSGSTSPTRR